MTVVLDSKDLATLDKEFRADSQVWDVLTGGAKSITEADFVGVHEVRVNKMSGFVQAQKYIRNGENARAKISIEKETISLKHEDWFAYDLERLDQDESALLSIQNTVTEHRRSITIPYRDMVAVDTLYSKANKKVDEIITEDNVLSAYDKAEEYMADTEVGGGYVMFVSAGFYSKLKKAKGVERTFSTNQVGINGVNRTVAQLDGSIPIIRVTKDRLKGDTSALKPVIKSNINFILVPLNVAAPIVKYGTVDYISADSDRTGYKDTIKGLDYYDIVVFDNARDAIYVSENTQPAPAPSTRAASKK